MSGPADPRVTDLLRRWSAGETDAAEELMPLVYDELRRIAERQFRRERGDHTLQATAVVHEAFLRMVEQPGVEWASRAHFLGFAARVVRRVLVDYSREHNRLKRGGGQVRVTLGDELAPQRAPDPDLIALDAALVRLAEIDPQRVEVVELKFFGGLTLAETAEVLGVSEATVTRQWRRAKAWLYCELHEGSRVPD